MAVKLGPILDANAVALWTFGESSGTSVADSVGTYPLTTTGTPLIVDGQIGNAKRFTGTSNGVKGAANAAAENVVKSAYTFEFWFYVDVYPVVEAGVIAHLVKAAGFGFEWMQITLETTGKVAAVYRSSGGTLRGGISGAAVPKGLWQLGAIRQVALGGSLFKLEWWLDGKYVETLATGVPSASTTTGAQWGFGRYHDTAANTCPIRLQQVRFSNIARTDAEMLETYTRGIGSLAIDTPYSRALKQLLPRGALWLLSAGSMIERTLVAIGGELERVVGRGLDLIEESDPRTASETLEDWETLLGLPDEVITEIPATDEGRRLAITQKLIRQGGQHAAFYIALAEACGYTVTINEPMSSGPVTRAGTAVAGDYLAGLWAAFRWELVVDPPAGTALSHTELEAVINKAKPAHTVAVFTYL